MMESLGLGTASRDDVVEFLKEGYKILSQYGALIETYILDFFTENVWNGIPKDWQDYLELFGLPELTSLIDSRLPLKGDPPESLKQLRFLINKYSLSRTLDNHSVNISSLNVTPLYEEIKNHKSHFSKSIFKQVKYKKQHEIMIMSEVVCKSAYENDVQFIIDIGSGKGHLARVLSMCYRFKVVAIEQNFKFTHEAEKLDNEVLKAVVWDGGNRQEIFMPKHVTKSIQFDTSVEDFEDFVERIYLEHFPDTIHNFTYGIIGLHPCGNLGPTLLRFYKHSQRCRFINLVSCCYNKLNTKYERNADFPDVIGYPLSPITLELDFKLSYSLRELACHATEKYSQKLTSGNYDDFTVHAYRAVLEKLITKKYPDRRHGRINNVKFKEGMLFDEYQSKALENSGISLDKEDITHRDTLDMLQKWKQVVIYYCLRLMFAPLIETQILLDRHLFVDHYDTGFCDIRPFFNCNISPRTHIFLANKTR